MEEQLRAAQASGQKIEALRTKSAIDRVKLLAQQQAAVEKLNTAEGKARQAEINAAQLKQFDLNAEADMLKLLDEQDQARKAALQPCLDEKALLEARLAGREDEYRIDQKIKDILKDFPGLEEAYVREILEGNEALTEQAKLQERNKQILEGVVNDAGRELMGLFDALITGTEDWNAVLSDTLRSLSQILLKAGINALGGGDGKGFFSILSGNFGGGRAEGGPVMGGTSYVVGERGPELFTPGSSGNITPNSALGGDTVVNITVNDSGSGQRSSSGSNKEDAARLARMIENSTLAVINREKRPGGSLSR